MVADALVPELALAEDEAPADMEGGAADALAAALAVVVEPADQGSSLRGADAATLQQDGQLLLRQVLHQAPLWRHARHRYKSSFLHID